VTVDVSQKTYRDVLDYSKAMLEMYQKSAEAKGGAVKIIEPPHLIDISGIKSARFVVDRVGARGKVLRMIDCKFQRGNLMVSVQCMDFSDTAESHLKDFEYAIKTFSFLESLSPLLYRSDIYDFSIEGPSGWLMISGGALKDVGANTEVFFKKYSLADNKDNFLIAVQVDELNISDQGKHILQIVKDRIRQMSRQIKKFKLVERPKEITQNSIRGVRWSYLSDVYGFRARDIIYQFVHNGFLYTIVGSGAHNNFTSELLPTFERFIEHFRLEGKQIYFVRRQEDLEELSFLIQSKPEFEAVDTNNYPSIKHAVLTRMSSVESYSALNLLKDRSKKELARDNYIDYHAEMWFLSPKNYEVFRWFSVGEMKPLDIWRVVDDKVFIKIPTGWMPSESFLLSDTDKHNNRGIPKDAIRELSTESYKLYAFDTVLEILQKAAPSGIGETDLGYIVLRFDKIPSDIAKGRLRSVDTQVLMWISKTDNTIRAIQAVNLKGSPPDTLPLQEADWFYGNFNFPYLLGSPRQMILEQIKDR
jgi:hypothetical protein